MELNTQKLIILFSTLLGIGAVFSFIQTNIFNSPITTTIVLATVALIIFITTQKIDDQPIQNAGVVLSIITMIAGILYSVIQLTNGSLSITLALAVLSIALLGISYAYQTDNYTSPLDNKTLKIIAVVLLVLTIITVAIDIRMTEPSNSTSPYSTIQQSTETQYSQYTVGTITTRNPSPLPVKPDSNTIPRIHSCLTGVNTSDERLTEELTRINLVYDRPETLWPYTHHKSQLQLPPHVVDILREEGYDISNIKIQLQPTCPESTENPTITIRK